jgi:phosphopantetheinyl transferase (holo-ACP synthase)
VSWHDFEVERETEGRPYLVLFGLARDLCQRHGPLAIQLSLSHSDATAGAVAILVRG